VTLQDFPEPPEGHPDKQLPRKYFSLSFKHWTSDFAPIHTSKGSTRSARDKPCLHIAFTAYGYL